MPDSQSFLHVYRFDSGGTIRQDLGATSVSIRDVPDDPADDTNVLVNRGGASEPKDTFTLNYTAGDVPSSQRLSYVSHDARTGQPASIYGYNNENGNFLITDGTFQVRGHVPSLDSSPYTIACFTAGTLIRTVTGEVPVEALAVGDQVVTASGAHRPIRWLGRRSYGGRFASRNPDVLPVCIQAGSLADGVPARDLWVSPKHAMLIDGVLVPAECLVNGVTVIKATRIDGVDYHHVELHSHDVLLAEGAPAESFVDDGGRHIFHNARDYAALYPGARFDEARYCAPRVEDGPVLATIRRRIGARAGARGAGALPANGNEATCFGT